MSRARGFNPGERFPVLARRASMPSARGFNPDAAHPEAFPRGKNPDAPRPLQLSIERLVQHRLFQLYQRRELALVEGF
jgi:hypothetical protein